MLGLPDTEALVIVEAMKWAGGQASVGGALLKKEKNPVMGGAAESSGAGGLGPRGKLGALLTGVTAMWKVCGGEVSTPPLAVPPLSWACTLTTALPFASAASV